MKVTEEELQHRIREAKKKVVIAGPDHPIYSGGLTVNSIPELKPSRKKP